MDVSPLGVGVSHPVTPISVTRGLSVVNPLATTANGNVSTFPGLNFSTNQLPTPATSATSTANSTPITTKPSTVLPPLTHDHSMISVTSPNKRKRDSPPILNGRFGRHSGETSPSATLHEDEPERKRQPGVKRACNECRQQKLRCNVVQDPFQPCSRCNRLKLECKIESTFKRVGKRSRHAEMEKEIDRLRGIVRKAASKGFVDNQIDSADLSAPPLHSPPPQHPMTAEASHSNSPLQDRKPVLPMAGENTPPITQGISPNTVLTPTLPITSSLTNNTPFAPVHSISVPSQPAAIPHQHRRCQSLMGSNEAVSSLMHLKNSGGNSFMPHYAYELDGVQLTEETTTQLFIEFFTHYHRFLPFLNAHQPPAQYYQQHPLLFWSIIAVASRRFPQDPTLLSSIARPLKNLIWSTIGDVPCNYYVVKALCLMCTWPLPTSTTSSDPTHLLCGVMMKIATMIGLHRPSHIQEFSRTSVHLDREQLRDRIVTWAVCNIVAQNVATGYGQPASTLYEWVLVVNANSGSDSVLQLPEEIEARLEIERFCDKVSREMYGDASDPRGVAGDEHRAILMRVFRRDFKALRASIESRNLGPVVSAYLFAAGMHLRLTGFFDSSASPSYLEDLMGIWRAAKYYVDSVVDVDIAGPTSSASTSGWMMGYSRASSSSSPSSMSNLHESILPYAPNYLQQMLWAAGFTFMKLVRSFFVRTIEFDRGCAMFNKTLRAIENVSVAPNDLHYRVGKLMHQMWSGAQVDAQNIRDEADSPGVDSSLQLKVRCRHSMSLVFDFIWRWREEYEAKGRGALDTVQETEDISTSSSESSPLEESLAMPSSTLSGAPLSTSLTTSGVDDVSSAFINPSFDFSDPQHWLLDGFADFFNMVPLQ